jgi:hypothetical protein
MHRTEVGDFRPSLPAVGISWAQVGVTQAWPEERTKPKDSGRGSSKPAWERWAARDMRLTWLHTDLANVEAPALIFACEAESARL